MKIQSSLLDKAAGRPRYCFVIAEAGSNHNGDMALGKRLIEAAKECGCDAVKFQAFKTENLVTRIAAKAEYQEGKSGGRSQFEMLKALELSGDELAVLSAHAQAVGIPLFYSVFDKESADEVEALGAEVYKLGSGEITNIPLIKHIASKVRPLIISTGMAVDAEIAEALNAAGGAGNQQLFMMHCSTGYPVLLNEANLRRLEYLEDKFGLPCGYSDHTQGVSAAILAAGIGCPFIEKHFTINKGLDGPDHSMSVDPQEMRRLCLGVRAVERGGFSGNGLAGRLEAAGISLSGAEIEMILGRGDRMLSEREISQRAWARKSIVAARDIAEGERLNEENLAIKRPEKGILPVYYKQVLGKRLKSGLRQDTPITWEILQ